ncbi:hypothetical protein DY000_02031085 [Brassica cretica]|uniref:Uncharacterized protein n=1 Tax=Brassica cretica TaxID=69181 RepID=A0ABQ7DQW0_BRACR|nr:hypothetical protein DY000_02031085 [Brassica cretica]
MPSSTRSNMDKHMLFSEDSAHLERTIRKDQHSTSLDAAAFTSTDSRTQPSTDTGPSSSTDLHRSTSIDKNGNLYDQDGHLRNATGQKLDAQGNRSGNQGGNRNFYGNGQRSNQSSQFQKPFSNNSRGPAVPEATRTNTCYSQKILLTWNERSAKTNVPHRSTQQLSRQPILTPNHRPTPDLHRRPIYIDENGNLYDQDGHLRNATGQKLDAQGNITLDIDRRHLLNRLRSVEKHPHPPSPFYVKIDLQHEPAIDRQRETDIDRPPSPPIDRRAPLTYRVWLPSIDIDRINALRPPPKPLANPPEPTTNPSDTTPEPMQVDEATKGRRLRKRKEKIPKNLKREADEKEMDGLTKRVLRIPVEKPFDEVYFTHQLWMFFRETK